MPPDARAAPANRQLHHLTPLPRWPQCEAPNTNLERVDGSITHTELLTADEEQATFPLTNNNILLRGCVLRNTGQALGIVTYSGEECKVRCDIAAGN